MNGISTLTQKGQVVIPLAIREYFNLKPSARIYFEIEKGNIIARPIFSIDQAYGMIKTKKSFSDKAYKRIIRDITVKKFKKESASHGIS